MLDESNDLSFPPDTPSTRPRNRRLTCGWKIALCFVLLFASFFCKDSPSASDNAKITLTFEDASCIETWLWLKIENTVPPYSVALSRDGNALTTLSIFSSDTLLIDEGLAPSTTYTYHARLTLDNNIVVQSPDAPARTMDTTSHNWVFDPPVMLGDGSSSVLYDVAIISDSNVWAVGELFLNDSSGQLDPLRYNAAWWDGNTWKILRVPYYYQGHPFYHPIHTVFAFDSNDIWFAGNGVVRWNGQAYIPMEIPSSVWGPNRINKIWGTTANDFYIVGDNGSIAHFNGTSWRRVESGTTLPIQDVFGGENPFTGQAIVLCLASNKFYNEGKKVLGIFGNATFTLPDGGLPWSLSGVWFVPGRKHFVVGDGLFRAGPLTQVGWTSFHQGLTTFYTNCIRGDRINNVVVAGAFGELLTFNGINWFSQRGQTVLTNGSFFSVALKNNLIVAVGQVQSKAVSAIGRRD